MSFPERYVFVPATEAPPGTWSVQTIQVDVSQWSDKGFDYDEGAGKAFTGTLQGSVTGSVWTDINALSGDAQGAISGISDPQLR